jgi:hypothetical protein
MVSLIVEDQNVLPSACLPSQNAVHQGCIAFDVLYGFHLNLLEVALRVFDFLANFKKAQGDLPVQLR